MVYTQGGLWQVDSESFLWSLYIEDTPAGGQSASILTTQTRLYLFDGTQLMAYDRNLTRLWQASTPPVRGLSVLTQYDDVVLITSNNGDILVVSTAGGFCNQARIYGQDSANQWHSLGTDARLRLAIADQLLALDWETFTRPCTV